MSQYSFQSSITCPSPFTSFPGQGGRVPDGARPPRREQRLVGDAGGAGPPAGGHAPRTRPQEDLRLQGRPHAQPRGRHPRKVSIDQGD